MFKKIVLISLSYLYLITNIAQAVIWEGESAGFNIRWTKSEITATTPFGRQVFSTTQLNVPDTILFGTSSLVIISVPVFSLEQ